MTGESEKVSSLLSSLWSQEWSCPNCGRPFNAHATVHTCGPLTVREHLEGRSDAAVELYSKFAHLIRDCGPVIIVPAKAHVAFQTRVTFAAVDGLAEAALFAHVVTPERIESRRFTTVEEISPVQYRHQFVVRHLGELDTEVGTWLQKAYAASDVKGFAPTLLEAD